MQHLVELAREQSRRDAQIAEEIQRSLADGSWANNGARTCAHRFAFETRSSIGHSKRIVRRARLVQNMPHIWNLWKTGELPTDRVDLFCEINHSSVRELLERDEVELLELTKELSFLDASTVLKYWLNAAKDAVGEIDDKKLLDDRHAHFSFTFGGAMKIDGTLDPVGGEIVYQEAGRIFQELQESDWKTGNERTPAQRRADALVEMAKRSAAAGNAKTPRPLFTIVAGDESFGKVLRSGSGAVLTPGQVAPYLEDADIESIIYDGKSRLIDYKGRRFFQGALRRALQARDEHCQDPSECDVPAEQCQVDHEDSWTSGGDTEYENGQCLCPAHNRRKGPAPPQRAA